MLRAEQTPSTSHLSVSMVTGQVLNSFVQPVKELPAFLPGVRPIPLLHTEGCRFSLFVPLKGNLKGTVPTKCLTPPIRIDRRLRCPLPHDEQLTRRTPSMTTNTFSLTATEKIKDGIKIPTYTLYNLC